MFMYYRIVNVPFEENRGTQQLLEGLNQRLLALGAEKGGMHYIFMLCFIQYRYQQGNDILAEAFKYYVRKYEAQAKEIVQTYFYKYHLEVNEQLSKLPMILELFVNNSIEENTPFIEVKEQVLDILNRENISQIKK